METKRLNEEANNHLKQSSVEPTRMAPKNPTKKSPMSYCKIRTCRLTLGNSSLPEKQSIQMDFDSDRAVDLELDHRRKREQIKEQCESSSVKPSSSQTKAIARSVVEDGIAAASPRKQQTTCRPSGAKIPTEQAREASEWPSSSVKFQDEFQQAEAVSKSQPRAKLVASSRSLINWTLLATLTIVCLLLGDYTAINYSPNELSSKSLLAKSFRERVVDFISGRRVAGYSRMQVSAQYTPNWPSKSLQQEIFLLNLEDGYFGCQVNESQDFLQLFELSKLCDGQTQCYLGTDEMASPLKCNPRDKCGVAGPTNPLQQLTSGQSSLLATLSAAAASPPSTGLALKQSNDLSLREGYQCVNGVCLDGLCYCNDGWGGKSCDVPDENECKFRPCDVFAHCTNTMGSYYCSCFPGYDGDGMHCQDINECEIPSLAALCSDNSECCNLPGHFVCKCKPGFQQSGQSQSSLTGAPSGNSTVSCTDIDECQDERACGRGAQCENLPGSYKCSCPPGFTGDPSVECFDMDECRNNPCGAGAQCTNVPGGYKCTCAPGFERNPILPASLFGTIQTLNQNGLNQHQQLLLASSGDNSSLVASCLDVNECQRNGASLCGSNAQCINTPGAYFCQCPPNYTGNPKLACQDIDECLNHACGPNANCKNLPGSFKCECKRGYSGNAYSAEGCQDEDECSLRKDACGQNAHCFNSMGSHQCSCPTGFTGDPYQKCLDIDECAASNPCGSNAQCFNFEGGYKCSCPDKFLARGTPEMGCERAAVDIGCQSDFDCTRNALCSNGTCQCKLGYQISGIDCIDVDECSIGQQQIANSRAQTKLSSNSSSSICGPEASCHNLDGGFRCECLPGYERIEPQSEQSKCKDVNECDSGQQVCGQNSRCFNSEGSFKCACNEGFILIDQENPTLGCKSPCDEVNCGQHATCKPHGEEAACVCKPGFTFDPNNIKLGCVDINECDTNYGPAGLCGQRAQCTNVPGSYRCNCPPGFAGDAYRYCEDINECDRKFGVFGQCGELAICNNTAGSFTCQCASGFTGDPRIKCQDVDECAHKSSNKCGQNAVCTNLPGKYSCKCLQGYSGDPYEKCSLDLPACSSSAECGTNFICQSGRCQCPYANQVSDQLSCKHPCDKTECGAHAVCQLDAENQALCVCDSGYMAPSDGRSGCVDVNECIQGATLTGMSPLNPGGNSIAMGVASTASPPGGAPSANSSHPCGRNALCRNLPGSFDCVCPPGYSGDAYQACALDVRNQQQQQLVNNSQLAFNQQEPRTSTCSEQCQRGQVCSGDGQCVKPDSCADNQSCKPEAVCEHVNQLIGYQCIDVCTTSAAAISCGPEAKCVAANHKATCACRPGFSGDPYDLINGCQVYNRTNFDEVNQVTGKQQAASTSSVKDDSNSDSDSGRGSQMGDISTVSLPNSTPSNNSTATNFNHHVHQQQQTFDTHQNKKQPLINYELPLPTSPALPISGAPYGQTQSPFGLLQQQQVNDQTSARQPTSSGGPSFGQTKQQQQQQQQSTSTATTTSNLFQPKRKPVNSIVQQQQQMISQAQLNRQDSDSLAQKQRQQEQQLIEEQQRLDSFNGTQAKSGAQLQQLQLSCTSDQHCPGNLFCLSGQQAFNQKTCGCPAGYRRESDYCFMHRTNCTSNSVCKAREECVSYLNSQIAFNSQQQFDAELGGFSGICICPRGYKLTGSGIACIDRNECDEGTPCALGAICQNKIGSYECVCPPGTTGEPYTKTCEPVGGSGSVKQQLNYGVECMSNLDCPSDRECDQAARKCISPCHLCGPRAICTATNHAAICLCPPRFTGNAIDLVYGCQEPPTATMTTTTTTTTISSTALPANSVSPGSTTLRPSLRESTPTSTAVGVPVTTLLPTINHSHQQAPQTTPPSTTTTLAPYESSSPAAPTTPELVEFRTIPPSELFVMCLADGIQVEVQLGGFNGIIYVKGHSQDPKCRKLVMSNQANEFVDFKVQFGNCDLIHRDGEAGFVLVIQKHPKLVTYRARAYHVKCVYNTGERTVTLGFNVSMITTSGTIANTGPPPTCLMSITALNGHEVTSAEIGQDLLLRVDVQPDSIYGGFARSCEAKTMDDEGEYQYEVTDANGCATDPSIFSDWKYDHDRKSLVARFNAFKFPSSNNLRFQCNIRVCFGSCPAVNCNGVDAYGKRRRRRRRSLANSNLIGRSNSNSTNNHEDGDDNLEDSTPIDELIVTDAFKEGALREEIMVQSNAILTFDRKHENSLAQQQRSSSSATSASASSQVEEIEFVCLPKLGIFMSIVLTALIVLLALAIATSCWCFNKRKSTFGGRQATGRSGGPLPHPVDFPNPLLRSSSSSISTLREPIYGP